MKNFFPLSLTLLFVTLLSACGPDKHHGRVEGVIEGINQAQLQAFVSDTVRGDKGRVDTVTVKRGKFSYDREMDEPVILTLLYPNFSSTDIVVEPGKTVKVKGDANRLSELELEGNDDNVLLTDFHKRTLKKSDSEKKREAATFVRTHPKTLAAVSVFKECFAEEEKLQQNPALSLLKELEKHQPKNVIVKQLSARLKPILNTCVGATLPTFSAEDINGKTVKSSDYKGKALFIIFYAQWDGGFYTMKHNLKDLQEEMPSSKMSYLFVSLDKDKEQCKSTFTRENFPGRGICDGKLLTSPLVKTLGLRYIPGNILIDSSGKIVARDISPDDWKEKIPELL